jgi:hypothetical protein
MAAVVVLVVIAADVISVTGVAVLALDAATEETVETVVTVPMLGVFWTNTLLMCSVTVYGSRLATSTLAPGVAPVNAVETLALR